MPDFIRQQIYLWMERQFLVRLVRLLLASFYHTILYILRSEGCHTHRVVEVISMFPCERVEEQPIGTVVVLWYGVKAHISSGQYKIL